MVENEMTARTKKYTVRFYKARYGADGKAGNLFDLFTTLSKKRKPLNVMQAGDTAYQMRGITKSVDGKSFSAYLVRFRIDKPAVGSKLTLAEEYLELAKGKEFIEKNHFIIFKEQSDVEILGYQCSREGGVISALAHYLTFIIDLKETITFDDILTKESLDAVFKKGLIRNVEFSVAKPTNKEYKLKPEDTWTQESFEMLKEVGASTFTAKIGVKSRNGGLLKKAQTKIRQLMKSEYTKRLKVKVSGIDEPIDLFAERIHDRIEVPVSDGGVINSIDIYNEIRNVKDQKQQHLNANFQDN